MAVEDIDFVVAAWREEGRWFAVPLPPHAADDLESLTHALRQQPGEGGVVGLVSIDDDTTLIVRVSGDDVRLCMSDPSAAEDYSLAAEVLDLVGGPLADEIGDEDPTITGDIAVLADLGMSGDELQLLLDDLDLYPDDVLAAVADRLGFAKDFQQARDDSSV